MTPTPPRNERAPTSEAASCLDGASKPCAFNDGRSGILHGGDYNPDQWLDEPAVIDEDFRLFDVAGANTLTVGVFAWARLEPVEGTYDFEWLDRILDRMKASGKNVILATPSGARPLWMARKYPEVLRVNRQGLRETPVVRHNHCWNSPVYRTKVREINSRLAERHGRHPAVKMWHVSNELSGECLCDRCVAGFHAWLKDRYETLDAVNAAHWSDFWAHRYTEWEQINPLDFTLDGLALDWRRYASWQLEDFYRWEAEPLRRLSPGVPVLTNLMGTFEWVNYHGLGKDLDVVAEDSYPGYQAGSPGIAGQAVETSFKFDLLRCLKGESRPWFLMESCVDGNSVWKPLHLKPPGLHHLEMFQALAHGADGTLYFQWRKGRGGVEKYHGGVVNHTHPEETRSFKEVAALSHRYDRVREIIGSINRGDVAVLTDWESRWAYRAAKGLPRNDGQMLMKHAAGMYEPFWRRGMTVDVRAAEHDFAGYKLVIVPRLYLLRPGFAARLRAYVEGGGWVLMTALTGMVNESNLCWRDGCPGDGLEELTGVWMEEFGEQAAAKGLPVESAPGNWLGLESSGKVEGIYARVHARAGTEVVMRYAGGWVEGTPVLCAKTRGEGRTFYLAADLDAQGVDDVCEAIMRARGLEGFLPGLAPLPAGVTVQTRKSDGADFVFLLNFSEERVRVPLGGVRGRDLETGALLETSTELAPWDAQLIKL